MTSLLEKTRDITSILKRSEETLAEELLFAENLENGIEIEFDDIKTKLTITK